MKPILKGCLQRISAAETVGTVFTSSQNHRRRSRLAAACAASLVVSGFAAVNAAEGPYPGLPRQTELGGWAGAAQTGITEARKARQWARVPLQVVAAYSSNKFMSVPAGDPRANTNIRTNYVYFVSPSGSEHNYGISPAFPVRTVAFGAVPVEATVRLLQRREDGYPVALITRNQRDVYPTGSYEETDTVVNDALTVQVTRLVVDGVDLGIGKSCQTRRPAALRLLGKGWWAGTPGNNQQRPWLSGNYLPAIGGVLNGTIDVPEFVGCSAATGEDVSQLLTATVSGTDNRVQINVSAPSCNRPVPPRTAGAGPPPPGSATIEDAGCDPDLMPPEIAIP